MHESVGDWVKISGTVWWWHHYVLRGLGGAAHVESHSAARPAAAVCGVVVCTRLGKTLTHVTCDHNIWKWTEMNLDNKDGIYFDTGGRQEQHTVGWYAVTVQSV